MTQPAPASPIRGTIGARGLIGLFAAIVGTGLMVWGFLAGIDAALNGSGSGSGPFLAIFFAGAALVVAALAFALVRLVRGRSRALSWATVVVALVPIVSVVVLLVRARG